MAASDGLPYQSPLQITIPIPQERGINYGVHSTGHHTADRKMVRFNNSDTVLIEKWCALLGISFSAFIRESALGVAYALEEHERKHNNRS